MIDDEERPPQRRGLTAKRDAITRAALTVFGSVGYAGSSIDMIAAQAAVSTRTIYNHFDGKEQLFTAVLLESSQRVTAAHEAIIERHLDDITDLEAGLVAFAQEWLRPQTEFADHFAIVQRIEAEGDAFPKGIREAWLEAGPLRVQHALAGRLARLAQRGLLQVDDAMLAAQHFRGLLVTVLGSTSQAKGRALDDAETDRIAQSGVHTFLYGYLPRG